MKDEEHSRIVVISDLHIGYAESRTDDILCFIKSLTPDTLLILNGDTFEDMTDRKTVDPQILDIVRLLRDREKTVFVCGNHDLGSQQFRGRLEGRSLEAFELEFDGKKYIVMHGHQFDYFENRFPKSASTRTRGKISQHLKHIWRRYLQDIYWKLILLKKKAVRFAMHEGFDGIIVGHDHLVGSCVYKGIEYYNSGAWINGKPCTYVEFAHKGINIKEFRLK